MPHVTERVLPQTMIYTDKSSLYRAVERIGAGHTHRPIYHSLRVYVQGDIHTSTADGFWALVKNGIGGVHHGVSTSTCNLTWAVRLSLRHPQAPRRGAQCLARPRREGENADRCCFRM